MKLSKLLIPLMGLALFASSGLSVLAATPADALAKMDQINTKLNSVESTFMDVRNKLAANNVDVTSINTEGDIVLAKKAQVVTDLQQLRALYNADPTGYQQDAVKRQALQTQAAKVKADLEAYISELKTLRGMIASILRAQGYIQ